MTRRTTMLLAAALASAMAWQCLPSGDGAACAQGWEGRRQISYQDPDDLFYNYYVGPQPSGTAAQMYVSPLPVPARVGHTYVTYQPLMPHEFLYAHGTACCPGRSYYTHYPGAGWTRTNVRYKAAGNWLQWAHFRLHY